MAFQGFSISSRLGLAILLVFASSELSNQPAIAALPAPSTVVAQTPLTATLRYVNPATGQDAPEAGGSETTPYRTLTYALQQAAPGTLVQLARGSYTAQTGEVFPIVVPPGVIVRGSEDEKGQTVAIIGGGNFISKTFARQNATIRAESSTEIRGISVTNPNTRGTGIWVESSDPTITNCTFTNNNREGVFVTGTGNPKIVQNVFVRNGGNGVSTASNARGEIRDNVFQNTGFGLAIGANSSPTVASNQIIENVDGLYINDNARPVLRNNRIENNQRDGLVATAGAKPDLGTATEAGNNTIRNNRQFNINNSTNAPIYSVGNLLDTTKIAGRVELVAPPIAGQPGSSFADVQGHWAQAYIDALAKRDVISGFPDGTFRPNDPVTRVQFAAILNKAFAPAPKTAAVSFQDVNTSFWGYQPIQSVVRGGFMRGYPEGVFKPNVQIPRVQVLVALSTGLSFPVSDNFTVLSQYQDVSQIPDYARRAVAAATTRKIVVNYPIVGQLNPNREATRAEVAALVYQALVNAGQAEAIPSPYIVSVGQ